MYRELYNSICSRCVQSTKPIILPFSPACSILKYILKYINDQPRVPKHLKYGHYT